MLVDTTAKSAIDSGSVTPQDYIWTFTGTPPGDMEFFFARNENYGGTPPARGVVITIDYPKAGKYKTTCGDNSIPIKMDEA